MQADDRARLLVVIDKGVAEAHPTMVDDMQLYCRAHADALKLPAAPLVVPGGEAIKNEPATVDGILGRSTARRRPPLVRGRGRRRRSARRGGYAAATAHRGMRLVRVPTTVLVAG